jgi:hypothetical protein
MKEQMAKRDGLPFKALLHSGRIGRRASAVVEVLRAIAFAVKSIFIEIDRRGPLFAMKTGVRAHMDGEYRCR